ncbi:MAG: HAD-IIIA family hydrolase [Acholeplasmataceae bacterium]|nr:HAD-IIIA family hydrolase [Acholeplasmataceae bacterium]
MKTILFDLDGTLIQTTQIILDTFVLTFKEFFPEVELSETELTNMLGHTLFTTFGNYTDSKEKVDEIIEYYRKVSNQKIEEGLITYPKAKETMAYLKKKGCTVGVVTSKMRKVATYHLELTGLLPYVDGLIGYEDTEIHKPNPEPILKALELFNAEKESTVYVGDHENDITAAKKAGTLACAVTYSHRLKEMLLVQPEFVIDELINLKDIV